MGYIFDPQELHEIGKKAVGLPHDEMVRVITDEMARAYPGHIETRPDWMFSLAAGATRTAGPPGARLVTGGHVGIPIRTRGPRGVDSGGDRQPRPDPR